MIARQPEARGTPPLWSLIAKAAQQIYAALESGQETCT